MSKRQDERAKRRRAFWSDKRARARGDLAATVQVNYDHLRSGIRELPKGEQQRWLRDTNDRLRGLIDDLNDEIRTIKSQHQHTGSASAGRRKP
ncbi:hypothetical protein JNW90_01580 [Micromonospora sp. STR1s_5]|nr:hypothetical protein [Micromonospora sp. STR1s_5]MBM0201945.1 hypothetical protein [Micromonospora sp. STR1s_5]